MPEPVSTHKRGIVRTQDSRGWRFIKIPSHQMNEMLSSGVGHFSQHVKKQISAQSHRRRGSRKENNKAGFLPPPQQQRALAGDGWHIAMLPSAAVES